jgi:uncharacterized protein (DUF2147 family)
MGIGGCKEACSNSVTVYVEERDFIKSFDDVKDYIAKTYHETCDIQGNKFYSTCVNESKVVSLAGEEAVYIDYSYDDGTYPGREVYYFLFKNGKLYSIRVSISDDAEKLVSTFKFTN